MKKIILWIAMVLLLAGCGHVTVTPIEGAWKARGTLGEDFSWFIQYTFENGYYTMNGYPPISEKGTYTVFDNENGGYNIELSETGEDEPPSKILEITISDDGQTMTETGGYIYKRVE